MAVFCVYVKKAFLTKDIHTYILYFGGDYVLSWVF